MVYLISDDQKKAYMRACLDLAMQGRGKTSPNPMVGAIVLNRDRQIVARGFHSRAGKRHAEIEALDEAGDLAKGGTLLVNLEPCAHHGRTPPCAEAIIKAGIETIIVGTTDPNPLVNGKGIERLREAGLEVEVGVLEEECLEINRCFFRWIKTGLPWVTLKIAARLDGRIGESSKTCWITGDEARARVQELRKDYDAVLTGSGTILADDPKLTYHADPSLNPLRVILDRRLQTSPEHKVYCEEGKTLVYIGSDRDASSRHFQPKTIITTYPCDLKGVLKDLGTRQILSVLVEAGQTLNSEFIEQGLYQEIQLFINPSFGGKEKEKRFYEGVLTQTKLVKTEQIGEDLLLILNPRE
ncbi:MAG: bifunctional diaminohydroxyphosphoribosylaminopyrimidine deaminase/5-amino-6-(5-phosphoribosylamino)uracil reductase RibD [Candidatus Caenarcaniphilales bacterium]|nr:bifunctional diaminohydroxyphosphoribosylaminopyrimidine deaminase/5-amino-6-(5-phosphoribosylamino)uracil reductase RibD [Candidatus Caenarcaniphilales bacterium]